MLRLARYLKPYTLLILLSIALLFVQANADLALPDYMSRIVNVGIQQGGIEYAVPLAIRQAEMEKLLLFMSAEEQTLVLSNYTLVTHGTDGYLEIVQDYPGLVEVDGYLLNDIDRTQIESISPILGRAFLVVMGIERALADPASTSAMGLGAIFDLSTLPPGTDFFQLLSMLPDAQLEQARDTIRQEFSSLADSMVNQMAVSAVKDEYSALGVDIGRLQTGYITRTGLLMLLVSLLSGACTISVGFLSARAAAGAARDLRQDVFKKVEGFSNQEFDRFSTASLITRSTNDVTQVQMVVIMLLRMVFYAPIIGVGGVIRALGKSTSMWWIIALAVVVLLGLITTVFSIALPKFKLIQNLVDRLNLVMRENLSGMMVIRAFNMQQFEEARFDRANTDLTATSLFINRIMVVMMPVMMFIMNGLSLMIIWVGSHQVADATMQVGDMMAFLQYAMQIVFAFLMLSFMFIILPRASVSAGRIADVLDTEASIIDQPETKAFPLPFDGVVEFRQVSFRYPDAQDDVLHDISFSAKPGETTAFIGSTGSGKSTIINLIPRFYDVTGGAILIDGIDIRDVSQRDLREKIGYIPQKGMLFSGTIGSNLRYADDGASSEVMREATDIAQASEFVFADPAGLEAEISQGGSNVSGGQKQRLSIARALVKKPPIYIFDDSFSALDFKTDSALRKALKEKTGRSTVFIVTQRVSTIKNAEQIIVLHEGRIVGKGAHRDLLKDCEVYRDIAESQLGKEALA
ncbi:MAG: ABC transporter ATP-binding protein [Chloroflexi bacterium]|nr:ABC transporter ATP-binding protein [Chloroflexota bacterium]